MGFSQEDVNRILVHIQYHDALGEFTRGRNGYSVDLMFAVFGTRRELKIHRSVAVADISCIPGLIKHIPAIEESYSMLLGEFEYRQALIQRPGRNIVFHSLGCSPMDQVVREKSHSKPVQSTLARVLEQGLITPANYCVAIKRLDTFDFQPLAQPTDLIIRTRTRLSREHGRFWGEGPDEVVHFYYRDFVLPYPVERIPTLLLWHLTKHGKKPTKEFVYAPPESIIGYMVWKNSDQKSEVFSLLLELRDRYCSGEITERDAVEQLCDEIKNNTEVIPCSFCSPDDIVQMASASSFEAALVRKASELEFMIRGVADNKCIDYKRRVMAMIDTRDHDIDVPLEDIIAHDRYDIEKFSRIQTSFPVTARYQQMVISELTAELDTMERRMRET
jgi:hypothetical protein